MTSVSNDTNATKGTSQNLNPESEIAPPDKNESENLQNKSSYKENEDPVQKNGLSKKESGADAEPRKKDYKNDSAQKTSGKGLKKSTIWTIKITVITFFLSALFSFASELASTKAHFSIMIILLLFLITLSIAADAVGVAATSCDLAPLLAMASRKEPGSKQAIMLVKNAEKVSNICCDVIGDICSIVSGACALAIVIEITKDMGETLNMVISILMSGVVSALTVGGKSLFKSVAVNNSKELILLAARIIDVFTPKRKKNKSKDKEKNA